MRRSHIGRLGRIALRVAAVAIASQVSAAMAEPGASPAPVHALIAELGLAPAADAADGWVVVHFTATRRMQPVAGATFEPDRVLGRIAERLNRLDLTQPVPLNELVARIQALDQEREWLPLGEFAPTTPAPDAVLRYRYVPREFTIDLHVRGEDVAAAPVRRPLRSQPDVVARYRGTSQSSADALAAAVEQAAEIAWSIAHDHGHRPDGPPGDAAAIRQRLTQEFLLPDPGASEEYRAVEQSGRASGVIVNPVFIPRAVTIELPGWAALEQEESPTVAAHLAAKRHARETEIRRELAPLLPDGLALVTAPVVQSWQSSAAGEKYRLSPLRYADETLVLGAVDPVSTRRYLLEVGASYGATDGLQGSARAKLAHEYRSRLEAGVDVTYGDEADAQSGSLVWSPLQPVGGWTLRATSTVEAKRNDEAFFGAATARDAVEWRRWHADLGLTAQRPLREAARGHWANGFAAGLHLVHADDTLANDAAVTRDGARPDAFAEFRAEATTATRLGSRKHRLEFTAQLRAAHAVEALGGHYDYRLGELAVGAKLQTAPAGRGSWQLLAATRVGRIRGAAPLGRLFRAGGDAGWIRGLQEGELAGRAYWAQSIAFGPEISWLLGAGENRPPAYLLLFVDWGEVEERAGAWSRASGGGVAVSLADLPLGGQRGALLLGYAYSPESRAEPHGAVFLRLEVPFVQ